ncbi:hypothetical protein ES705_28124 [subsurface metagenome]
MKSSNIKNWSYLLSYAEITELDDFTELLAWAIANDTCLFCHRLTRVREDTGLCTECGMHLEEDKKDREAMEKVLKDYEVSITVKKR